MRVLFVDDHEINRRVVKDMLGAAGVEMAEAPEAETGLRMIDETAYDLILMDLRMPGMDGLAAVRRIRARTDAKADVPIIMVTADVAPSILADSAEAGADDVLHKPVDMGSLFDAIAAVLVNRGNSVAVMA